jgi:hypothetical protein
MLQQLRHLEKLELSVSIRGFRLMMSERHSFANNLRYLSLLFDISQPAATPVSIWHQAPLPKWIPGGAARHDRETLCLFPHLSTFETSRMAYLESELWEYLLTQVCPNVKCLKLFGELTWEREFGTSNSTSKSIDNVVEEGRAEDVVRSVVKLAPRLRKIVLNDAWKECCILSDTGFCKKVPTGYFVKKQKFMKEIAEKNVQLLNTIEIWDTYRGFQPFSNAQPPWKQDQ